ncbi:hypothetical protein [Aequorivita sp. Q41]|uniref:hypothetical protein n=1 Tax=Aequorivita sp. Q41 TaxID=3153300 RepID=UPI00324204A4
MKILKVVLLIVGIALIVYGFYSAFMPQKIPNEEVFVVVEGLTNQTLGMIGIGILALIAGVLLKNRS